MNRIYTKIGIQRGERGIKKHNSKEIFIWSGYTHKRDIYMEGHTNKGDIYRKN